MNNQPTNEIKIKQRTIKLAPIKVKYINNNRLPFAVVRKRKATIKEAMHILRNILRVDVDSELNGCDSRSEQDDLREKFTEAVNDFLDGSELYYDDQEVMSFTCYLCLISYCQKKGIL